MDAKDRMKAHSHYPLTLRQVMFAEKIWPILGAKIRMGDYVIDVVALKENYPGITWEDIKNIVYGYEEGLIDTQFTLTNTQPWEE